jgi:hypothetical protein
MLNSYVPFCILILLVGAEILKIYFPWWMWIFAIVIDCYNINETREWRRSAQRNRLEAEEADRIVRASLAPKE